MQAQIIRVYVDFNIKLKVFKRLFLAVILNNLKEYVNLKESGMILKKNCHLSAMHME